jgi:pimeloyl-ACP methyl ester carboxylesterase
MRILCSLIAASCFFLSACSDSITPEWLEQKYTDGSSEFLMIDGNRVHYRDEGLGEGKSEGEGDVIILIHGTASSLHTWDAWTEKLKQDFRVIRMDLPGFGLTGPDPLHRYEVQDDTAFMSEFLKALDIESAHMVGSSLGGRIAWQYALEYPQQVKSLTLMNALGYPQEKWPPPIEMAQWPIMDTIMESVSPRFMYKAGLKDVYFDSELVTEKLVDRYYELSRYPGNLGAFPKRVKARLDKDSALITGIRVPTLIMWGKEDLYFPVESAHRFNNDIPNSRLVVFADVGHLPMEEEPDVSAGHLIEFLHGKDVKGL